VKGVSIMNGIFTAFVSYTLATLAGICFVGGIAVLSSGRR